jgi:hypothetical protein
MTRKTQVVFILFLCFLWIFAVCRAEAYTYVTPQDSRRGDTNEQNDPYLQKLLARFPEHKKILDKLYDSYSGWIIELSEKYGEAPLLAMNEAKEDEYAALFRDPEVFIDLYRAMESVKLKSKRACLALRLANAMLLKDPQDDYVTELERAKAADRDASRHGIPSRRYVDAFFAKGIFPDNLLSELRKEPYKYTILLNAFSEADAVVLESIVKYPNALAFLLNSGPDGVKLLEETNGEIVTLSYIMTNEDQARLPTLFKEYRLLAQALASCEPEAFFIITAAPKFYFALASSFSGNVSNRYFVAYAVLSKALGSDDSAKIRRACDFLNNLTQDETRRIARLTAEFLESADSNADDETSLAVAPFFDPWFFQFVQKYGRAAIDVCAQFGDFLNVGTLLMEEWEGISRDVSPIIEAIRDYNVLGLQAAMMFRYNERMQEIILLPDWGSRHKELLMFLFYDSFFNLSVNMSDWTSISRKLLDDYRAETGTGKPVPRNGTQLREFIPGYDLVKPAYDWVRYGQTPTVGDVFFAALDLAQLIPIGVATSTLVKEFGKNGLKRIPGYVAQMGTRKLNTLKKIPSMLKGGFDDTLGAIKKLSLTQLRQQTGNIVNSIAQAMGNLSKVDVWAIASMLRPNMDTLSNLWSSAKKFASVSTYHFVLIAKSGLEWLDDLRKLFPTLRSNPWMVKHATEAFINGIVVESVLQPTLFYGGVLSLYSYIESRQLPVNIERSKEAK